MRPYVQLFRGLADGHVRYAVAGGLAVVMHGVPRMTFDLDLVFDAADDNTQRLIDALEREGYRPRLPVKLAELGDRARRDAWVGERSLIELSHPERPMEEVDLLLVTSPAWDGIAPSVVTRQVDGVNVPIVGRRVLRAMKLASGRDKDLADAALLDGDDVTPDRPVGPTRVARASPTPSPEQLAAFARLSVEERFRWYCDMLELCFAMSTEQTRARWREAKTAARAPHPS